MVAAPLLQKPIRVRRMATNKELREALTQIQQAIHDCTERAQMGSNGNVCNECANEIQHLVEKALRPRKSP